MEDEKTTVAVSVSNKDKLDKVAESAFGTTDVSYNATVSYLINHYDANQ